jgi:hypothetical protein
MNTSRVDSGETSQARYLDLSMAAQTAYAELLESSRAQEVHRSIASLSGSFASKDIKGKRYWYYQYRDIDGSTKQLYVGPGTPEVQSMMDRSTETPSKAIQPLARAAIAHGCASIVPKHFRIIRRLSEYGFFHAGGVLIGTHAYLAYGNMLGVRWGTGDRTFDVDFAHAGKNISIALPANIHVDVHKAVESLDLGFLPISTFDGASGATYLNPSNPELRLDFLTTISRSGGKPFTPANLNVILQPLKFMEFPLENTTQAALFCAAGAVVVNVPSPARYALHKLLVYGERSPAYRTKARKDIAQAAALFAYFKEHQPDELRSAWADLISRGRGWVKRADEGCKALSKIAPELDVRLFFDSAEPAAASPYAPSRRRRKI